MSALATTMIYAFDVAEQTHYYFDQSEANQAYAKAELAVEHPDWREPMTVLGTTGNQRCTAGRVC
ncbi:hypothetical protein [Agarivorans sp. QJM3NY_25]|uniref:hypothetical protein n=1 Tax=Agarivorans sp. QJM3NY_25 TaxID=3421430 RepID=UPI003D7D1DC7